MSEVFTNEPQNPANPYQAPSADGANEFADRPTLPVSPIWALLIPLSPLAVTLGAAAAFARVQEVFVCLSLAYVVLSLDGAAFASRTLWIGAGRLSFRAVAVALVTMTIALSPAALLVLTGREFEDFAPVRFAVQHLLITCLCASLAAIVFACGSRDRLRAGAARLPLSYDVAAVAFATVLATLVALCVVLERSHYSAGSFAEYARGFDATNYGPPITTVATFLMTMVWRVLVRGTLPLKSWTMLGLGTIAGLWTLSASALAVVVWLSGEGGLGLAIAFSLVVVPVGREFFLLVAGYRAINAYAKQRRMGTKVTVTEDAES